MPPSHKRLLKEASELSASPSPHFHAAPVHDNLYDWHFTLAGPPPPSPYSGGIYHGRIVLPPTYPLRPPSFRFLTPTGRFEVNREICLSISGHHEESWQPAWGIRTALIAIRSFMDGDAKGQVGGLDVPEGVRREYARQSGEWCCEICGRSNGVILGEWREECREKGVAVEEDDRNGGGDGGGDGKVEESEGEGEKVEDCTELVSAVPGEGDGEDAGAEQPLQEQQPFSPATAPASTATSTSAALAPAPAPAPSGPTTSSTTTTPAPTPTRTQRVIPPVSQTNHSNTSQDGPWLDRAIIGVLIALAFMILRRIANTEE